MLLTKDEGGKSMKKIKRYLGMFIMAIALITITGSNIPEGLGIVEVQAAKIGLSKTKLTLVKGQKYTLKVTGTASKAKWYTSNKSVATVNSKGLVTAKKAGKVKIAANVKGKKYYCSVTVENPELDCIALDMFPGESYQIHVVGSKQKVTWKSSNSKIASVNNKGKVLAKKVGYAVIYAKVGIKTLKCEVAVMEEDVFTASVSEINIKVGAEEEIIFYSSLGSSMRYEVKNSNVAYCKWGEWDGTNHIPLTVTGLCIGDTEITVTETNTQKELVINVHVYSDLTSFESPRISTIMSKTASRSSYWRNIYMTNLGNKPIRILGAGAFSFDNDYEIYDRKLKLVRVDGNHIQELRYSEIAPGASAIITFYTENPSWYDKYTRVFYWVSYEGKMYSVTSTAYYGSIIG